MNKQTNPDVPEVVELLRKLATKSDKLEARRIRARLRRIGHRGGLATLIRCVRAPADPGRVLGR